MRRFLSPAVVVAVVLTSLACGGDSGQPPPSPTAAAGSPLTTSTSASTPAPSPTPAGAALADLSLVYFDRSKGQGAEVYAASFDGTSPKKVVTVTGPSRPLAVLGKTLAVAGQDQLTFYDLTNGATKNVTAGGTISDGRFLSSGVFLYTSNGGCGPQRSVVMRVDLGTMEQKELAGLTGNLSIAAVDAASSTIAIVPLGCDPAIQTINLYGTNDGREISKLNTPGCGYASVSLVQKRALISWMSCTPTQAGAQATYYDFAGATLTKKDITGPGGGINSQPILLRPGSNEAVFGTKSTSGTGPGSTTASGIWQVDWRASP